MLVKQGCLGKVRGERVVCSQDRCKEDAERAPGRSSEGRPTPHVLAVTVVVRALIRTLVYACTRTSDMKTVVMREKTEQRDTNSHRGEDAKGASETDPHGVEGLVVGCLDPDEDGDVVRCSATVSRFPRLDVVLVLFLVCLIASLDCWAPRCLGVVWGLLDDDGAHTGREAHLLDAGCVDRVDVVPEDALALFTEREGGTKDEDEENESAQHGREEVTRQIHTQQREVNHCQKRENGQKREKHHPRQEGGRASFLFSFFLSPLSHCHLREDVEEGEV